MRVAYGVTIAITPSPYVDDWSTSSIVTLEQLTEDHARIVVSRCSELRDVFTAS
jgi:hypothetical protein